MIKNRALKKTLLMCLLAISVLIYVVSQEHKLLNDFGRFLELEIGQALSRKVTIGEIKGGLLTPIILTDVNVFYGKSKPQEVFLKIREMEANKRVWELPFVKSRGRAPLIMRLKGADLFVFGSRGPAISDQRGQIILDRRKEILDISLSNDYYSLTGRAESIYNEPQLDLKLDIDSGLVRGNVSAGGPRSFPNVAAEIILLGLVSAVFDNFITITDERIAFDNLIIEDDFFVAGEVDMLSRESQITVKSQGAETIKLILTSLKEDESKALLKINDLKIRKSELKGSLTADIAVSRRDTGAVNDVSFDLRTDMLILDYQPVADVYGKFYYEADKLVIDHLCMGEYFILKGSLCLGKSREIDLSMKFSGLNSQMLKNHSFAPGDFNFSAVVDCRVDIKGAWPNPYTKVHFITGPGFVKDIQFESIRITIDGEYPLLHYRDSRINRKSGYLTVEGRFDLRKLPSGTLFEDMVIKTDEETIIWEGWDITKRRTEDEFTLRKNVGQGVSVWYKGYLDDETKAAEKSKDAFEVEYEIFNNRLLKMKLNKDEEFFGLENRIRF